MKKRLLFYFTAIIILVIIAGLILATHKTSNQKTASQQVNTKTSPTENTICSRYNIPADSCNRAVQAGEYCPSWDAKPGQISSSFCIKIKVTNL